MYVYACVLIVILFVNMCPVCFMLCVYSMGGGALVLCVWLFAVVVLYFNSCVRGTQ